MLGVCLITTMNISDSLGGVVITSGTACFWMGVSRSYFIRPTLRIRNGGRGSSCASSTRKWSPRARQPMRGSTAGNGNETTKRPGAPHGYLEEREGLDFVRTSTGHGHVNFVVRIKVEPLRALPGEEVLLGFLLLLVECALNGKKERPGPQLPPIRSHLNHVAHRRGRTPFCASRQHW